MIRAAGLAAITLLGSACSIETGPRITDSQLYREALLGWCAETIGGQALIPTELDSHSERFWQRRESEDSTAYSVVARTDTRPVHTVSIIVGPDASYCSVLGPPDSNEFAAALRQELASQPYGAEEIAVSPGRRGGVRTVQNLAEFEIAVEIANFSTIDGRTSVVSTVTRLDAQEASS